MSSAERWEIGSDPSNRGQARRSCEGWSNELQRATTIGVEELELAPRGQSPGTTGPPPQNSPRS